MPCYYEPTPTEIRKSEDRRVAAIKKPLEKDIAKLQNINNVLSVKLDRLHEDIIKYFEGWLDVPNFVKQVREDQIKHRQDDLDRLLASGTIKDPDTIRRVALADPNLPLEPQLGFNPDDY